MRVDAHQHFWRIADRVGQWPPPELAAIHRDFMPGDLEPLLREAGIDGTVLVQTMETEADTAFMLDLARSNPFILGVVGWTDLKSPDAAAAIERLARDPMLRGFRPMLQDIADDRWIDDPALEPALSAMIDTGLVFSASGFVSEIERSLRSLSISLRDSRSTALRLFFWLRSKFQK